VTPGGVRRQPGAFDGPDGSLMHLLRRRDVGWGRCRAPVSGALDDLVAAPAGVHTVESAQVPVPASVDPADGGGA
jgi:hypothetical protein